MGTSVHVLNISSCVCVLCEVLEMIWSGKNIYFDHLCIFRCKIFVHIPEDEISKVDVKSKTYVCIGYALDGVECIFYDHVKKNSFRSFDVEFIEDYPVERYWQRTYFSL